MFQDLRFHPHFTDCTQRRRLVSLERGRHSEGHSQRFGRGSWSVLVLSLTTRGPHIYHRGICPASPFFSPPRQERPCTCYARCHLLCCRVLLRKNAVQPTRLKCTHILISQASLTTLTIGCPYEVTNNIAVSDPRPTLTQPGSSFQWWE